MLIISVLCVYLHYIFGGLSSDLDKIKQMSYLLIFNKSIVNHQISGVRINGFYSRGYVS